MNNESSASFKGGFNLGGSVYRDSMGPTRRVTEQLQGCHRCAAGASDGTPVLAADGKPMTATTGRERRAYQLVGLPSYRVVIVS